MEQKSKTDSNDEIKMIKTEDIKTPASPIRSKADEDKMEELIDSISRIGLINPIVVFKRGKLYEIITGHRRYIACKALGLGEIPARVVDFDETKRDTVKLHENIIREDVNAMDQARFFTEMINKYGFTHEKLAEAIGKSRSFVSSIVRLLNYPRHVQEAIEKGEISYTTANILMAIEDEATRDIYINHAIEGGITVRTAETWVKNWQIAKEAQEAGETPSESVSPNETPVYHPPTCYYCGLSIREVPLESMLVCLRCKLDIRDILGKLEAGWTLVPPK